MLTSAPSGWVHMYWERHKQFQRQLQSKSGSFVMILLICVYVCELAKVRKSSRKGLAPVLGCCIVPGSGLIRSDHGNQRLVV